MIARCLLGLTAAAIATAPLCAAAQDMTPVSDRILSDPTYLPLKGEFYGETSYGYEHDNVDIFDDTGASTGVASHHLNDLRQYFAYGITDQLSVNVGESYGFSGSTQLTTPAGPSTTSQSGFSNPTIGATYRALDQRDHPVSLDFFTAYSPDAFTARSATDSSDASVARGGPSADFGLAIGRETRAFTIRGSVTATYLGRSNLYNPVDGYTTAVAAYWTPSLGIQTQTRLTNRLSLNVDGSYTFNGTPAESNNYTGVPHTADLGDYQTISTALNYQFVPNRLVGSIVYSHTFYDQTNYIFPSDPTLDSSRARSQNSLGVALRYAFR